MIKRSTMILIVVTAVIMVLGVAYAAMTSRDLNINGNLVADINQDNFLVKFLTETEVSDSGKVTAIVTSDTTATIAVQGLSAKGDTVTATYIVKNMSEDLSADLVLGVGNNNKEYFKVTAVLGKESLTAGEQTTAVVTVELLKTLVISDQSAQMQVQIVATPVQPGNEGTTTEQAPEIIIPDYVTASEIFDAEGTNENGLHIGDFVNYDAGTWTEEEISAIKTGVTSSLVPANGSTDKPSTAFQFGGFTAGMSRNENATPYSTTYNYVKDSSTGSAVTGWRVFDVEGDTVTLISAGNPEDYYHPYVSGQSYAYVSEYILTGNINSSWSTGATDSANYQKRDWSAYVNTSQKAESATVLTKSKLDSWYTKYTDTANADTWTDATFQKIYTDTAYQSYQNMIENYSYYWLSAAYSSRDVYHVDPSSRNVHSYGSDAYGVRVLVSLSSEVKFLEEKAGTRTVTGGNTTNYGGDQTYNVWDIN